MYPNYDRKNNTSRKIATLTVVAMGIISLLAPPYLLSAGQEAFATKSDKDDRYHDKKYDDKKDNGSEIPPAYIEIDGELSELQLENGPPEDRTADYDIDPQGTLSFGEEFSLIVPQGSGVLNVESAQLSVNDDELNQNDYLQTDIELVDEGDDRDEYFQTYLNAVPGGGDPDALGDGYTASEEGFEIFLWWTVSFTDGTEQTYLAVVHLEGDECEEHGWVSSRDGTTCFDPDE
jgi:hypothetical protein